VVLFLHTASHPTDERAEQLTARDIRVVEGEVATVEVTDDHLSGVRLCSGEVVARRALAIGPRFAARDALLGDLGARTAEHPLGIGFQVQADPTGQTAVPGIWVAGNVADVTAGVLQAAASGVSFKVRGPSERLEMTVNGSRVVEFPFAVPRMLVNNPELVRVVPISDRSMAELHGAPRRR